MILTQKDAYASYMVMDLEGHGIMKAKSVLSTMDDNTASYAMVIHFWNDSGSHHEQYMRRDQAKLLLEWLQGEFGDD